MGLSIGVLGPLLVQRDGISVPIESPKQRLVVVRLVLGDGPVSVDGLVDALWGDRPPASALTSLRAHISRLRTLLRGGEGPVIVHDPAGYRLASPVELDADRFTDRVAAARASQEAGRLSEAAVGFAAALASWRGEALAGFRYEPFAQPEIVRWEALRLEALEARLTVELELGVEVAGELDALVLEHPLRERLHELLMHALYREGRTADALDAYRRARDLFVTELGLEPSDRLAQLQRDILSGEPELLAPLPSRPAREAGPSVASHLRTGSAWTALAASVEVPPLQQRARCELLLTRGAALRRAGQIVASQRTYTAAARLAMALDDPALLAEAALGFAGPPEDMVQGDPLDEGLMERSLVRLPADDPVVVRLRARLAVHLMERGELLRGDELLTSAIASARKGGDRRALAYALRSRHRSWFDPSAIEARLAVDDELIAIGDQLGDDGILAWGHRWRGIDALELGLLEEAEGHLDALEGLTSGEDELFHRWGVAIRRAGLALLRDPLQKAETQVLEVVALTEQVRSNYTSVAAMVTLWSCRLLQGRAGELGAAMEELVASFPMAGAVVPFTHRETGRLDAARDAFRPLAEDGFEAILAADPVRVMRLQVLGQLAECAAYLDDRDSAAVLYEHLAPFPQHLIVVSPGLTAITTVQHCLGRLAATLQDREVAIEHFEAALERCTSSGAVNLLPRTQLSYAALLRDGDPSQRRRAEELEQDAWRRIGAHGLSVPPDLAITP